VTHVHHVVALATRCERTWDAASSWATALVDRLEAGERCRRSGFLHGTAGVVLTLLASATDAVPGWNRALLVA
jgi:hypothetical protein